MGKKLKYIKEYFEYKNDVLGIDLGKLAVVEDEVYKMELYDISYIDYSETDVILKVKFSEINNPQYNGNGSFKHIHSDLGEGFNDTTPIKLDGILIDIYNESPEIIIEFIEKIYDQIKY